MEIIASKIFSEYKELQNFSIIELYIYTTFHALKYTQYTVIHGHKNLQFGCIFCICKKNSL
uniref:Uncharacterized protein n=1 Tax=Amphimedon queenslandica TaxID=400682 RepID=A0A1X7U291_AMPQE